MSLDHARRIWASHGPADALETLGEAPPDDAPTLAAWASLRARVLVELSRADEARQLAEGAARTASDDDLPAVWEAIGRSWIGLDDDEARRWLERARDRGASDVVAGAWLGLAQLAQRRGHHEGALVAVRAAQIPARGTARDLEARLAAAAVELVAGSRTAAQDHVDAVLATAPDDARHLRTEARMLRSIAVTQAGEPEPGPGREPEAHPSLVDLERELLTELDWEATARSQIARAPVEPALTLDPHPDALAPPDDADLWLPVLTRAYRVGSSHVTLEQARALRLAALGFRRSGRADDLGRAVRAHGLAHAAFHQLERRDEARRERDDLDALRGHPFPAGPFDLVERLGRGAAGEVWQGRHYLRGTKVAVKVLIDVVADRSALEAEARAVGALDHPGIVRLLATGDLDETAAIVAGDPSLSGRPWFAMQLVRGGTLDPWLGRLDWPEVRAILLGLLDALAHAHARHVLHLDLKPGNVLLDPSPRTGASRGQAGVPRLADFGLAGLFATLDPTRRVVMGTPRYMAPEQFRGDIGAFGPWTDLYQLGCIAWALIAGRPPFAGDTVPEQRRAHTLAPFPPLPPGDHPAALADWLSRLVDKEPAHRFEHAADAAWALRELARTARPSSASGDRNSRPTLTSSWRTPALPHADGADALDLFTLRRLPFVGRESLRHQLWDALREAFDGGSGARLVEGPPGSGRQALTGWLAETAEERGVATAVRVPRDPPGPARMLASLVRQALRVGATLPFADVAARLPEGTRDADVPALERVVSGHGTPDGAAACLRLLAASARRRTLLVDVDAADLGEPTTLAMIRGLLTTPRVLVIIVHDPAARDPGSTHARAVSAPRLPIAPPTRAEVQAVIESVLPLDPGLLRDVVTRTGGLAAALAMTSALVRRESLVEQPDGRLGLRSGERLPYDVAGPIDDAFVDRVESLSPAVRDVLGVCALWRVPVSGRQFRQVCDLIGVTWRRRALKRLVGLQLLEPVDDDTYALAHPALEDVVIEAVREVGRLPFVATIASARFPTPDEGARGELLALAGQPEAARGPLLAGARSAIEAGDPLTALTLLARRRDLPTDAPDDDIVGAEALALGAALQRAWAPEVDRAFEALDARTRPADALVRAIWRLRVARFRGATDALSAARSVLGLPDADARERDEARLALAELALRGGDVTAAGHLDALEGGLPEALVEVRRAEVAHAGGDADAVARIEQVLAHDVPSALGPVLRVAGARLAAWDGDLARVERWLGEASALVPPHDRRTRLTVELASGWLHLARRDWPSLELEAERILRTPRLGGALVDDARWLLVPCRVERGTEWDALVDRLSRGPRRATLHAQWLLHAALARIDEHGLRPARRELASRLATLSPHHRPPRDP